MYSILLYYIRIVLKRSYSVFLFRCVILQVRCGHHHYNQTRWTFPLNSFYSELIRPFGVQEVIFCIHFGYDNQTFQCIFTSHNVIKISQYAVIHSCRQALYLPKVNNCLYVYLSIFNRRIQKAIFFFLGCWVLSLSHQMFMSSLFSKTRCTV